MIFKPDSLKELSKDLPKREEELETESRRIYYIRSFMILAIKAARDGTIPPDLARDMSTAMRSHMESGGSASEAITRLIGIGLLDDFPETEIIKLDYRHAGEREKLEDKEPGISIAKNDGITEARIKVFFEAQVPGKHGRERWDDYNNPLSFCSASFVLRLADKDIEKLRQIDLRLLANLKEINDKIS